MRSLLTRMVLGARKPQPTIRPALTPAYGAGGSNPTAAGGLEQTVEATADTTSSVPARARTGLPADTTDRRDLGVTQPSLRFVTAEPAPKRSMAPRSTVADVTETQQGEVLAVPPPIAARSHEAGDLLGGIPSVRPVNATPLPSRMSPDPITPAVPPPQTARTDSRTSERRSSQAGASSGSTNPGSRPLSVTVSIGHIEVRAATPQPRSRASRPRLTLGDFLEGRSDGRA